MRDGDAALGASLLDQGEQVPVEVLQEQHVGGRQQARQQVVLQRALDDGDAGQAAQAAGRLMEAIMAIAVIEKLAGLQDRPIVVGSINPFGGRLFGVISTETLQPSEIVCGGFVAADYAFYAKVSESHPLTTCRKQL